MKRLDGLDKKRWVEINKYIVLVFVLLVLNGEKFKFWIYYIV